MNNNTMEEKQEHECAKSNNIGVQGTTPMPCKMNMWDEQYLAPHKMNSSTIGEEQQLLFKKP